MQSLVIIQGISLGWRTLKRYDRGKQGGRSVRASVTMNARTAGKTGLRVSIMMLFFLKTFRRVCTLLKGLKYRLSTRILNRNLNVVYIT